MKNRKRQMLFHSFYDHTGIEAHLGRMAERGWLLDKIGRFFWHYRRVEPRKLAFCVSYFPKASQFDPGPTEAQETFYDLCAHTGWTLAASSAQMQVFYNEREDPTPIDTDPALEIDAIRQSAKKSWLIPMFLFLGLSLMEETMFLFQLLNHPLNLLCSPYSLFAMVCYAALFLLTAVELGTYYRWRSRAKRAAEQGEFLATRSHPVFQKLLLAFVTIGFVWLAASQLSGGSGPLAILMVGITCGTFLVVAVVQGVSALMKRKNVSKDTNRMVTWFLSIGLSILLVALIPAILFQADQSGWREQDVRPDEVPLALTELLGLPGDTPDWHRDASSTQSPLVGFLDTRQYIGDHGSPDRRWLTYHIVTVRAPFLYGVCKEEMLTRHDTRDRLGVPDGEKSWYEPSDPAPWGAEEAYEKYFQNPAVTGPTYLLCYPGRIVEIDFDWEPTPEQIALAAERLGGA